jgi:hypothetical protein
VECQYEHYIQQQKRMAKHNRKYSEELAAASSTIN